ncbi:MAG TPA: hypothetical protein DCY35_08850 [Prolixibacteraceae bacterium]|nr:hypothetical protein [Prolixibacteraceae bacterium]
MDICFRMGAEALEKPGDTRDHGAFHVEILWVAGKHPDHMIHQKIHGTCFPSCLTANPIEINNPFFVE